MISSEVQRTLVKSPPELWAELSDPAALARHLGEFGEIRITRIDPEQAVEWEAEDASGKVQIKPSAWGTKVTLTVTRQMPQPDAPRPSEPPAQPQPAAHAEPDAVPPVDTEPDAVPPVHAEAEPVPPAHAEPDPVPAVDAEPDGVAPVDAEPEPAAQSGAGPWVVHLVEEPPDAVAATATMVESGTEAEVEAAVEPVAEPDPAPLPRRGFFSRLFGRRRSRAASALDPAESSASAPSPSEPPVAITAVEPQPTRSGETTATWESQFGSPVTVAGVPWQPQPEEPRATDTTVEEPKLATADGVGEQVDQPAASADAEPRDISEELEAAEETAAEETAAALTAVLDRLGAAHHRPFSRG